MEHIKMIYITYWAVLGCHIDKYAVWLFLTLLNDEVSLKISFLTSTAAKLFLHALSSSHFKQFFCIEASLQLSQPSRKKPACLILVHVSVWSTSVFTVNVQGLCRSSSFFPQSKDIAYNAYQANWLVLIVCREFVCLCWVKVCRMDEWWTDDGWISSLALPNWKVQSSYCTRTCKNELACSSWLPLHVFALLPVEMKNSKGHSGWNENPSHHNNNKPT